MYRIKTEDREYLLFVIIKQEMNKGRFLWSLEYRESPTIFWPYLERLLGRIGHLNVY